jgi:WD40 repeat protein
MSVLRWMTWLVVLTTGSSFAAAPPAGRYDLYGDPLPVGAIARMGTVRWRPRGGASRAAFVPGGKLLATSNSESLSFWDVRTGRVVRTIVDPLDARPNGFSAGFAFTPDGERLLSGDAMSGKGAAFFARGRPPSLLLWDVRSSKLLSQSPGLGGEPRQVAIHSDGRMTACTTHMGDIVLWDPANKSLRYLERGRGLGDFEGLAFTKDGRHLLVVSRGRSSAIRHFEIASGKTVKSVDVGRWTRLAVAANDGAVAVCMYPFQLQLYHPTTGKQRRLPLNEKVNFLDLSFSTDGRTLVTMAREKELVWLWDVAKGELLRRLRLPGLALAHEHSDLLVSDDRATLAIVEHNSLLRTWDAHTGQPHFRVPQHVHAPDRLAFSFDSKELISHAGRDDSNIHEIIRWDTATGKCLGKVVPTLSGDLFGGPNRTWLLSPNGSCVAEQVSSTLRLHDTKTGKRLTLNDRDSGVTLGSFSPDGRFLTTIGPGRTVQLWDTTTGKLHRRMALGKKTTLISWQFFTADGRGLVTGESWLKVNFWEADTGKLRHSLVLAVQPEGEENANDWSDAVLTPDRLYLLMSTFRDVRIWDVISRQEGGSFERDEYKGLESRPRLTGVSVDGRLLAWFDSGGNLRLSEIASGQIIHRFEGYYSTTAFSPCGWRLAASSNEDACILVWDIPTLIRSASQGQPVPKPDVLWTEMSSTSALRAHRALWRLAVVPEADAFLSRNLHPVEPVSSDRLRTLIADLGSRDFSVRQKAERSLSEAREAAAVMLAEAHRKATDVEVRLRMQRLLDRLQSRAPERLRESRAVMVLEARGTPAARRLLARFAAGVPAARLTQEAKAALKRLEMSR